MERESEAERRRRKHRKPPPPWPRWSTRTWVLVSIGCTVAAGIGVALYASDQSVLSTQLNALLMLPLVGLVLFGLHRALPIRTQWILAIVLAPVGSVVYLIKPNAQWWNYGAYSAIPLAALAAERGARHATDGDQWFGGSGDGPWGPP